MQQDDLPDTNKKINLRLQPESYWRERLNDEQFHVCRQKGTEKPFSGLHHKPYQTGKYVCVCCQNELFHSRDQFNSGSGWPSFSDIIDTESVVLQNDDTLMMHRIEVVCARCDAHLGHVFEDGPPPTGQRYCMNSVALRLITEPE